jgi:hypothetical protein
MKNIVLYGAGYTAEKFLCLKGQKYKISFCIDKNADRTFHGLPVYSIDDGIKNLDSEIIVVTVDSDDLEAQIKKILIGRGLVENIDFFTLSSFDKKKAVLYGNCHIFVLCDYLQNVPKFGDDYSISVFPLLGNKYSTPPTEQDLVNCDLLITQDIRENNRYGAPSAENVKGWLSCDAKSIKIPNLFGRNLFFPQAKEQDTFAESIHIGKDRIPSENSAVKHVIGFRDDNIERMIEEGKRTLDICKAIWDEEIYSSVEIKNRFDREMKKIIKRESQCDISISDYIMERFKDEKLFYDPNHPSKELLYEMSRRILLCLGYKETTAYGLSGIASDGMEMFVYGCVKKTLGMKWEQEYIKGYQKNRSLHNRPISLDEYIEEYKIWHYDF